MLKATVFAAGIILLCSMALAGVPQLINYQGRLTDVGGNALDTTVSIVFTIYDDSTGGTAKWTETQGSVTVTDGLFNVLLGSVNPIMDTVFNDDTRYLGITVGGDPEISPRIRIVSVGYAMQAKNADTAAVALSGPAGNSGWSDDGTIVRLTTSTDNVGIGTSSPSEKLDVDGNIRASGTIKSGSSITINGTTDEITASGGVVGFDDEDLETDGDIRLGNTTSITDGIKLGIRENLGTVNPFMKFYVESSIPSDLLNSAFEIYSPAYDYTPIKILGAGAIIQSNSNKIGRGEVIRIDPDPSNYTYFNAGNVGIGTDTPSERLEVDGVVHSTTGGFRFPDGTVQQSAAEPGHPANLSTIGEGDGDITNIEETFTILLSSSLSAPTSGYAMVIGTGGFTLTSSGGSASVIVGVSDNPASLPPEGSPEWILPSSEAGVSWQEIITVHNVFPVSAGANTFYFLARKTNSMTTTSANVKNLSVVFIPAGP
jgi:hypothetical protein